VRTDAKGYDEEQAKEVVDAIHPSRCKANRARVTMLKTRLYLQKRELCVSA
jgi:hypothetical protein